jgi:hypothetical protein
VATEIKRFGGSVQVLHFNAMDVVDDDQYETLAKLEPTHLMYFATPPIFCSFKGSFGASIFERFARVYVASFGKLANHLARKGLAGIYYPSSVALNEGADDMIEYIAAKASGEKLCMMLQKRYPELDLHFPRLPRLATDQTASLVPRDTISDLVPLMTKHIRLLLNK